MESVRTFLTRPGGLDNPGDDWLRIAKLIGHRNLATLLRTDVHPMGLVHLRYLNPG